MVEGLGSANFLDEVKDRPVNLSLSNRVVYSAHAYAWSGWGSIGGSYSKRSYSSFVTSMHENWGYLLDENIAPVWMGEFGKDISYFLKLLLISLVVVTSGSASTAVDLSVSIVILEQEKLTARNF